MSGTLYQEVYQYLKEVQVEADGMQQCMTYMNLFGQCISSQVAMAVQERQFVSCAPQKFSNLASEANTPLKVLVMGEFKTGKSTLINVLLGEQILKTDVLPTTAVPTYICYGEKKQLVVWFQDGSRWCYPIEQLKELTAEGNNGFTEIRKKINKVYLYLPLEFLRYITLIDSPGINVDIRNHVEATEKTIEDVDMVFWVMSVAQAAKKGEIEKIQKLPEYLKPMIIFNGIDLIDPEEERVEDVIRNAEKRVRKISRGCLAVSAYQAQLALLENDREKYDKSNWASFCDYFLNIICKKWYLWKMDAIRERLKFYYDADMERNNKTYKKEMIELRRDVERSTMNQWDALENSIAMRKYLGSYFPKILSADEISDIARKNEWNRLGMIMQVIGLLLQENSIVSAFSNEEVRQLKVIYQSYGQQWYYMDYYAKAIKRELDGDKYRGDLEQVITMLDTYNQTYRNLYQNLEQKMDLEEEEYYKKHEQEIEEYRKKKERLNYLYWRLEMWDIFRLVKQQVECYCKL